MKQKRKATRDGVKAKARKRARRTRRTQRL